MLATKTSGLSSTATLVRFALLALVPVVALGAVLAYELNVDVQQRYLETARSSATLIAQVGVQPLLSSEQVTGGLTTTEVAQMDEKLQGASVSQEVRRIKVWNSKGTIVYSDNHAIIGRTFPIDDDLGNALAGTPKASITDGHDEENTGDNLQGPLVQVYVPLVFQGSSVPSGAFELYLPYAPIQAAINSESQKLYGLLAAGLTFFYVSMLLVVYIAERWRRRLVLQAETTALANMVVLERLNRVKSEFLTRISHQFRTALVGIEGFTEVIRDSENLDLDEVKAFASDIHSDAERLDRAFTDMVELDRMEGGRAILDMHRLDVNQLINRAVEAARNQDGDHVVTTDLDSAAPAVSCDKDKIAQVLSILLANAIKYSAGGTEVVVASRATGEDVEVSVKDHGPGMPSDFDDALFVGYQKQGSGKSNGAKMATGAGTGLGLPIARQIVELHGGRMWFDSKAGQGTEFHFTLPMKVRPSRAMAAVVRP
jgi:signal transduction histidine kinase